MMVFESPTLYSISIKSQGYSGGDMLGGIDDDFESIDQPESCPLASNQAESENRAESVFEISSSHFVRWVIFKTNVSHPSHLRLHF